MKHRTLNTVWQKPSALIAVALTLVLAACSPSTAAPKPNPTSSPTGQGGAPLANTSWRLVSFGPRGSETPVLPTTTLTLKFEATGRAGGNGGCNLFGGPYTVDGNKLTFGQMVSTMRACADDNATQQEGRYLSALGQANSYTQTGDSLTIEYNSGKGVLNYVRDTGSAPAFTPVAGNQTGEAVQLPSDATRYIEQSRQALAKRLNIEPSAITLDSITSPAAPDGAYIIKLDADGKRYEYQGRRGEVLLVSDPLPLAPPAGTAAPGILPAATPAR